MSGFASLGQGALKTAVYEVKDFWVPNPELFNKRTSNSLILLHDAPANTFCRSILQREIGTILDEINMADHRALDNVFFETIILTHNEREAVYEAVIELVEARLKKAESV